MDWAFGGARGTAGGGNLPLATYRRTSSSGRGREAGAQGLNKRLSSSKVPDWLCSTLIEPSCSSLCCSHDNSAGGQACLPRE